MKYAHISKCNLEMALTKSAKFPIIIEDADIKLFRILKETCLKKVKKIPKSAINRYFFIFIPHTLPYNIYQPVEERLVFRRRYKVAIVPAFTGAFAI